MHPEDLIIPRWFLRLMSCVLGLAVPWAGWVTLQLATIEVKVEHAAEMQAQVQSRLHEHLADAEMHRGGGPHFESQFGALERRIEIIEQRGR